MGARLCEAALTSLSHVLLALDHDVHLFTNLLQATKDLGVAIRKVKNGVRNVGVVTELADQSLDLAEVVAGHTWEQMVNSLELQTAVNKVQPGGTVDIHGGAQLALGERLGLAQVRVGHAPVRQGDLDVQRHGDDVGDEDKDDTVGPGRDRPPHQTVAEQEPVAGHAEDLGRLDPPSSALAEGKGLGRDDVEPRQQVKVEASYTHDRVVSVLLVWDHKVGGGVPEKNEAVVVGGVDGLEEGRAGGENWDVLDIGVVLRMVCDQVVHVVAALPPSNGQATAEIGDEHADDAVSNKVVRDGTVASVMGREHDLVPEEAKADGRRDIPAHVKETQEGNKQCSVAGRLLSILEVGAVVVAHVLDFLMQVAVPLHNGSLKGRVDRGVDGSVDVDFVLDATVGKFVDVGVIVLSSPSCSLVFSFRERHEFSGDRLGRALPAAVDAVDTLDGQEGVRGLVGSSVIDVRDIVVGCGGPLGQGLRAVLGRDITDRG